MHRPLPKSHSLNHIRGLVSISQELLPRQGQEKIGLDAVLLCMGFKIATAARIEFLVRPVSDYLPASDTKI